MDYLVYAYLQSGRDPQAAEIIHQLKSKSTLAGDFKSFYATTAMPVRYAVELRRWDEASAITAATSSPPEVAAVAIWARGLGLARRGRIDEARAQIDRLAQIESQLRSSGQDYWVTQTSILGRELTAWCAQQQGKPGAAVSLMRQAADEEDAVEKLPITPGPIVPAAGKRDGGRRQCHRDPADCGWLCRRVQRQHRATDHVQSQLLSR